MTLAVAQAAADGSIPLLGPPSHIGGRHIGPAYFWYVALLRTVSGKSEAALIKLDIAAKLAGAALLMLLTGLLAPKGRAAWAAIAAGLVMCSGKYPSVFRDFWQPHSLFLFSVLFLFSLYRFLKGREAALVPVFLSASLLVQQHFSALILVASAAAVTGVYKFSLRRMRDPSISQKGAGGSRWIFFGAGLAFHSQASRSDDARRLWRFVVSSVVGLALIALWTPVVWYEIRFPSNVLALYRAFFQESGAVGYHAALHILEKFFEMYGAGWYAARQLGFGASGVKWLLYALLIAILCGGWSRLEIPARALLASGAVSTAAYTLALGRQTSALYEYYLSPLLPCIPLVIGIIFAAAMDLIAGSRRGDTSCRAAWSLIVGLTCAALVFNWAGSFGGNMHRLRRARLDILFSLYHAEEIADVLRVQAAAEEVSRLIAFGSSSIMEYAYYYYWNRKAWSFMKQAGEMKELNVFQGKRAPARRAFMLVCPLPDKRGRSKIWQKIDPKWRRLERIDLSQCRSCRRCRMFLLERKTKQRRLEVRRAGLFAQGNTI